MALRLLIDVSVGYLVEEWLRDNGYDNVAVRDLDPTMPDDVILENAAADLCLPTGTPSHQER
jgi:hypothetical protein